MRSLVIHDLQKFMSVQVVRFNNLDQPEFIKTLRKRVNQYFKDQNITRYANLNMKLKTAFFIGLYSAPLVLMLTGVVSGVWPVMAMWVLMGLGMSGIGLSIMHDANHGSYSKNPRVNKIMGSLLHFIGGYRVNWQIQHNVLHHSFTNVEGHDEDIQIGLLRFSPNQERKWMHRFQAIYAPFLYSIMTIYWFSVKDWEQIVRYHKKDLLRAQGLTPAKAFWNVLAIKVAYVGITIVLPLVLIDLPWWQVLLGFGLMQAICGLTLALIFQVAHVIEETDFFEPDDNGSVENHWAIHQMRTTANFANGSRLFSWFIGGLNFQIEHHLFPNICHVHYRKISKIVRETAQEFNLPYNEHRTWAGALRSHFRLLHQLGTGKYRGVAA